MKFRWPTLNCKHNIVQPINHPWEMGSVLTECRRDSTKVAFEIAEAKPNFKWLLFACNCVCLKVLGQGEGAVNFLTIINTIYSQSTFLPSQIPLLHHLFCKKILYVPYCQFFLVSDLLLGQGIRATFTATCHATMLHCKLRLFVARITTSVRNKFSCCRK